MSEERKIKSAEEWFQEFDSADASYSDSHVGVSVAEIAKIQADALDAAAEIAQMNHARMREQGQQPTELEISTGAQIASLIRMARYKITPQP